VDCPDRWQAEASPWQW